MSIAIPCISVAALGFLALASASLVVCGLVGIVAWVYDRRAQAMHRNVRALAFTLHASTEVCNLAADRELHAASPWTPAEEAAYQRQIARRNEIEASKRGDLIAAACFAELSEVDRG